MARGVLCILGVTVTYTNTHICRYIMYIRRKREVFLLDRDNSVFSCTLLTFPARAPGEHISDTLLDGVCVKLLLSLPLPLSLSLPLSPSLSLPPYPSLSVTHTHTHTHTLSLSSLSQELVEDLLPNGVRRPRYLAYDIMQLCGRGDIARCDHATRLQCIQMEIMAPRDLAVSHE